MNWILDDGREPVEEIPSGAVNVGVGFWDGEGGACGAQTFWRHGSDLYKETCTHDGTRISLNKITNPRRFSLTQDQRKRVKGMTASQAAHVLGVEGEPYMAGLGAPGV